MTLHYIILYCIILYIYVHMIYEIPWLKKHRVSNIEAARWRHISGGPQGSKCHWEAWLKGWKLLGFFWQLGLHFHSVEGVPPRPQKKMTAVDVRFDVCFECVVLGWQLPELPKEHVSNYVFPMRCWGTSAASKTFRWSNSSAGGFWRGVIGVLTYSRLIQDRHGQPNMARSNGHCEGSKRLTKPSRRDCEAMVPHSASHVEPLPKAVHHYLFWGRFGMLCQ